MKTVCSPSRYNLMILLLLLFIPVAGCSGQRPYTSPATQRPYVINNRTYFPIPSASGYEEVGVASWYGKDFHGRLTSNGETYNMYEMTAAHKLLPMHTMLLVTNLKNGKQVVVRVNDRGPFVQGRIVDLSLSAAKKLGIRHAGTARVKIVALGEVRKSKGGQQFARQVDFDSGEYFVQIGAFTQKNNGLRLQQKFLENGHRTVILKVVLDGKTFYRVQVYVGTSLRSAKRSEAALLQKGYRGAFIIAQ